MRGTLHKTESGTESSWEVWYYAKDDLYHGSIRVRILPLLPDDAAGLFIQDTDNINHGKEVEFEIFDNRQICNCACHRDPNITHFVACCNDGYKTDNLGHVNYYAKLVDQKHTPMKGGEGWDKILNKAIEDKATRPLTEKDAWPVYPEVKIICPRCKALMPCSCNSSWDDVFRAFHLAEQQVPIGARRLILDVWLTENYNPPTKKQD